MKISHTIDINSTPETVFQWLNDPTRAMDWMSSVSQTELLHETVETVGTIFRETVGEDGRSTDLWGVITDYRPNRSISFHLEGESHAVDVEYCLEPMGNGTRLTQNATVRFTTLFMKVFGLFLGPLFKKQVLEQSQMEFARLKQLCEAPAPE